MLCNDGAAQAWAIVFQTWPALPLLLWANVHWTLPAKVFASSVAWLFAYACCLLTFEYLGAIKGAIPQGRCGRLCWMALLVVRATGLTCHAGGCQATAQVQQPEFDDWKLAHGKT